MTLSVSPRSEKSISLVSKTNVQNFAERTARWSVVVGAASSVMAVVATGIQTAAWLVGSSRKDDSNITAVWVTLGAGVAWLGCRTVSYLCTETKQKKLTEAAEKEGLDLSNQIGVRVLTLKPDALCSAVKGTSLVVTQPHESPYFHAEFNMAKRNLRTFHDNTGNIPYSLIPLYGAVSNRSAALALDVKISSAVLLTIFTPKKNCDSVMQAVKTNRGVTVAHLPITVEEGTGRWETLKGGVRTPCSYTSTAVESETEFKVTAVVHRSNLLVTLTAIAKVHPYNEIGHDIYPLGTIFDTCMPKDKTKTLFEKLWKKVSKYVKFLFSSDMQFMLVPKFKLRVVVNSTYADIARAAIGENCGGIIGNYAHCTFTQTCETQNKEAIECIESVVTAEYLPNVKKALGDKNIPFELIPLFASVPTATLRQKLITQLLKDYILK